MEITVKEVEYCKVDVHYEMDVADVFDEKSSEVAHRLRHKQIPGFRTGKAPVSIIKQYFKSQIKDETVNEFANDAVQNTIAEKNLKLFGKPQFNGYSLNGGKFICDFSMFIQPTFELKEYKGFDIPKPKQAETADALAQKTLQEIRVANGEEAQFTETDVIAMGDNVVIKYSCTIDGKTVERLCADNELVRIGKTPIPEFDEHLVDMKAGEEKTFTIKLPEDGNDALAGQMATFTVSVILGSKVAPAPLDDELAKKVGLKSLQELNSAVQAMSGNRVKEMENAGVLNQISARLVANHDFKVPSWLTLAEAKYKVVNDGINWDEMEDFRREQYLGIAERSVRLTLVLNKIREEEPNAQLTEEETLATLKQGLAKQVSDVDEAMKALYKNGQLPSLYNRVKDEYALEFIRGTCKIVE